MSRVGYFEADLFDENITVWRDNRHVFEFNRFAFHVISS